MKNTLIIFLFYLIICPFIPFRQTTLSQGSETCLAERSALLPKHGPAIEIVKVKGKSGNNIMQDRLAKPKLPVRTGDGQVVTPKETFADSDKPDTNKLQTLKLTTPWGYNKAENAGRKYPLVVNGNWGEGNLFSEDVRKKYPSFYLDFNHHTTESDGATLATLIDEAIRTNYRIDTNRIYLTGFSAGGSGSFKIVRGMLSRGKLFAGIVRIAGQSESVLPDGAVNKTSLWYHIGLKDLPVRIDVARATYMNLKGKSANATAVELITTDTITGYPRITKTLTKHGIEIIKMSEYEGLGHEPGPCYKDPALFDWLFSQSLSNR